LPEFYEFKFIVNNVWKCSKDYPTLIDEKGNLNNFLDLRYLSTDNQINEYPKSISNNNFDNFKNNLKENYQKSSKLINNQLSMLYINFNV